MCAKTEDTVTTTSASLPVNQLGSTGQSHSNPRYADHVTSALCFPAFCFRITVLCIALRLEGEMSNQILNIEDVSVGGVFGRIMFFTVFSCATCHCLWNILAIAKMLPQHPRLVLLPLCYFVMGLVYAFLRGWVFALAIAFVHLALGKGMNTGELAAYVVCLSVVVMFYSGGRIPNLYSM